MRVTGNILILDDGSRYSIDHNPTLMPCTGCYFSDDISGFCFELRNRLYEEIGYNLHCLDEGDEYPLPKVILRKIDDDQDNLDLILENELCNGICPYDGPNCVLEGAYCLRRELNNKIREVYDITE